MAGISTTISIVDKMTSPMKCIISVGQNIISILEDIDIATDKGFNTSKIEAARRSLDQINAEYQEIQEQIKQAAKSQDNFNQKISSGTISAGSLVKTLTGLSIVQKGISCITNQLDSAISRMDTMTNFNRTMTAVTGSEDLANASLSKLEDMTKGTAYGLDIAASAVQNFTTRGMDIGSATSEVGKWADAVSFYGDGTNETLTTVTDALGKMLSKGTVEMEQLNRLTDAGINAVGIYAQATGQSSATVQENLSEGVISAQDFIITVSTAFEEGTNGVLNISGAAKEAGETWETTISNCKAAITRGLVSMIDSINQGLTNAGFNTILGYIGEFGSAVETILGKIGTFAGNAIIILSPLLNLIKNIGNFFINNWSIIAPIIGGIAIAFIIYNAVLLVHKATLIAHTIANVIDAIAEYAAAKAALRHTENLTAEAVATYSATVAQTGFNTALLACPLTWIVIAIIAVIAIFVALAAKIAKTSEVANNAFSVICGWINVAIQFGKNLGSEIANIACGIWEVMKACWNNVYVAFNNTKCNLQQGWYELLSTILNVISSVCEALNNLPFVEFDYSGLTSKASEYASKAAAVSESKQDYSSLYGAFYSDNGYFKFSSFENGWSTNAYTAGAAWGNSKWDSLTDSLKSLTGTTDDLSSLTASLEELANSTTGNTGSTASNTASIADSVSASQEDLKYIRDLAETEAINRFTTAEINVNMTNNNTISSDMDLDGVTEHLRVTLESEMNAVAEGAH